MPFSILSYHNWILIWTYIISHEILNGNSTRWFDGIHWLNGHEFKQALGDGEGQESLAFCSAQVCKESDMTE